MFELLLFDARSSGRLDDGKSFLARLRQLRAAGAPREATNREYFRWWAGRDVAEVNGLGRSWFEHALQEYDPPVIFDGMDHILREHRRQNRAIVLVSGSFAPALSQLAAHIRADDVLSSEPIVEQGRYTGSITTPMIGQGKAAAVAAHASRHQLKLQDSHSYGDDISDVPFMELTGHRVFVNSSDPELTALCGLPGWSLINAS